MQYPKSLGESDRRAHSFYVRLNAKDLAASTMGVPAGPYARLARALGMRHTPAPMPAEVDAALASWRGNAEQREAARAISKGGKKASKRLPTAPRVGGLPVETQGLVIYRISCTEDSRVYVGKTNDLRRRWSEHRAKAKAGVDGPLYVAMHEIGIDKFRIEGMIVVDDDRELSLAERHWISHLCSEAPHGFNQVGDAFEAGEPGSCSWRIRGKLPQSQDQPSGGRVDLSGRDWYAGVWDRFTGARAWRYGIEFRAAPGPYAPKSSAAWFSRSGARL